MRLLLLMMKLTEGEDGVGCSDVTHGETARLLLDVALAECLQIVLVSLVGVVVLPGPADWVVLQFESSEQVHGLRVLWSSVL